MKGKKIEIFPICSLRRRRRAELSTSLLLSRDAFFSLPIPIAEQSAFCSLSVLKNSGDLNPNSFLDIYRESLMRGDEPKASMELLFAVLLLIPTIIFFLLKPITKKLERRRLQVVKLPPGPRNLPLIGSIHHLIRRQPTHHTLRDLSAVHGPIMHLRLGERRSLVISSSEAAREIMKTQDLAFASRPLTANIKTACYGGKDLVFAPYGEYWRQMRRLCMMELFSPKRVLSFRAIREEEASLLLKSIASSSSGVMVNLRSMLAGLSNNIVARSLIGGTCDDQKAFLSAIDEVIHFVLSFSLIELYPSLPHFISHLASFRLRRSCLFLDRILEKALKEHREKRAMARGEMEEDVTDVLLKIQQDSSSSHQIPLSDVHIKAFINDIILAGSETSSTVMEWVMSELVRNPAVMKKAQSEVREILKGKTSKRMAEEELISGKLSFLPLVINETLRLHPPAPLLLPRENQEPCKVMGYEIPAKTMVMVNAWAIGRDPNTWKDPDVFLPERFEGNCGDLKAANFEYIPFGAGRRICPGIHFGSAIVETTVAYLLYYFDWRYVPVKGEELDMTESFGLALRRKTPLCLMATPHFPLSAI